MTGPRWVKTSERCITASMGMNPGGWPRTWPGRWRECFPCLRIDSPIDVAEKREPPAPGAYVIHVQAQDVVRRLQRSELRAGLIANESARRLHARELRSESQFALARSRKRPNCIPAVRCWMAVGDAARRASTKGRRMVPAAAEGLPERNAPSPVALKTQWPADSAAATMASRRVARLMNCTLGSRPASGIAHARASWARTSRSPSSGASKTLVSRTAAQFGISRASPRPPASAARARPAGNSEMRLPSSARDSARPIRRRRRGCATPAARIRRPTTTFLSSAATPENRWRSQLPRLPAYARAVPARRASPGPRGHRSLGLQPSCLEHSLFWRVHHDLLGALRT